MYILAFMPKITVIHVIVEYIMAIVARFLKYETF